MDLYFRLNPVALTLLIPGLISTVLAIYILCVRRVAGSRVLAFVNIAVAISSLAYGAELASLNIESMMLVTEFEYLGIAILPVLWLILTLIYTGHTRWVRARYVIGLCIIPFITIVLVSTSQFHHIYYSSIALDASGPFPQLAVTRGLWYWVNSGYAYVAVLLSAGLLVEKLRHRNPAYRSQIIALIVGLAVPALVNILYLAFGVVLFGHVVLTPFAFAISGLVITWSIFRYHLFSIIPIAREHVIEGMKEGVIVVDSENKLGDMNAASRRIFGWNNSDLGKPITGILQDWPEIVSQYQSSQILRQEIIHGNEDDRQHYEVTMSTLSDRKGRALGRLTIVRDITEWKILEQKLEQMATHDALTGLPGRVLLVDRVEMAIKRARRNGGKLAVMMLDLDHFKNVNDTFGHSVGNSLLKAAGSRLKECMRKNDTLSRWGGDEFVILLPEIASNEEAKATAARLLLAFQNPISVDGHTLPISFSLGIAVFPDNGEEFEELFKQADSAMYQAKKNGRNRYEIVQPGDEAFLFSTPETK